MPRDFLSNEERSVRMRTIKGRDTGLEKRFRAALWAAGVRGWRCNSRDVYGKPDLCWKSRRIAVFLDSAWWHGHPSRWQPGRLSREWDAKIIRNKERDVEVNETLRSEGWNVIRFWDFEVDSDIEACISAVKSALAGWQ